MQRALEEARYALEKDEVPIGATIVDGDTRALISSAHNEMEMRKDPTAHAEMLAIQKACALVDAVRLEKCDLYVTLEPCPMCAQAISFARLRRVYFGAYDTKGGGIHHGAKVYNASSCHHKPEVIGGIEEQACSLLLKNFFEGKR